MCMQERGNSTLTPACNDDGKCRSQIADCGSDQLVQGSQRQLLAEPCFGGAAPPHCLQSVLAPAADRKGRFVYSTG